MQPYLLSRSCRWLVCLFAFAGATGSLRAQSAVGSREASATQEEALFIRALTEMYLGDHERAVRLLKNVLASRQDDPALYASISEAYAALGQQAESLYYAAQAVEYGRDEPSYYTALAEIQAGSDQPDAAISTYGALLSLRPSDIDALANLGQLQEQTGRLHDALATYHRLIGVTGGTAPLRLRMEALNARLGNHDEALRMLEIAAAELPSEPTLQFRLGLAYRERLRNDEAEDVFEQFLLLEPANIEGTLILAELYEGRGDFQLADSLRNSLAGGGHSDELLRRAAMLYERAREDPAAAEEARQILENLADDEDAPIDVLLMLGDLAFQQKQYALAADVLGRSIDIDPTRQNAWEQGAAARLYAGNAEGAAALAEEGVILFPGSVALYRVGAFAFARLDRPRRGIAMISEGLALLQEEGPGAANDQIRLLSLRGLLHDKLGEHRLADSAFESALLLDPDGALVLNNYAYILAERGVRLEAALEMALRANEREVGNAHYLDTLGWVYYKLGRLPEAAGALEAAILADADFALLHEHLGDVYAAWGRTADAIRAWERAAELEPENESVRLKLQGR